MIKLILLRLLRRIAYIWRGRLVWEYESCERCGHCYRLAWWAKDGVWRAVYGSDKGTLCIDCFAEMAEKKGITLSPHDFERIEFFEPEETPKTTKEEERC